MRARWVMLIAGGFLVLAVAALLFTPTRSTPVAVRMLGQTNDAARYVIEISNVTQRLYVFRASTEYETNGNWKREVSNVAYPPLLPHAAQVFTLPKPEHGTKARIVVFYGRVSNGTWEHWRDTFRALAGFYPKGERLYIQVP